MERERERCYREQRGSTSLASGLLAIVRVVMPRLVYLILDACVRYHISKKKPERNLGRWGSQSDEGVTRKAFGGSDGHVRAWRVAGGSGTRYGDARDVRTSVRPCGLLIWTPTRGFLALWGEA